VIFPRPDDFHVHLRQGAALALYTQDLAANFGRALIMPNTLPPVRDPAGLIAYRDQIVTAAQSAIPAGGSFIPLMSFKLLGDMLATNIAPLKAAGAVAAKLYPQGATTNAQDGVAEIETLFPVFQALQDENIVLCIHSEDPQAFCLDREKAFLPHIRSILQAFPRLRVVIEHASTAEAVQFVLDGPDRLGATITVHHLLYDLDAVIGDHLQPHMFCKPVLKRPEDKLALQHAVSSGHPRFFFGSDSAPHDRVKKECDCGAAGVYSAPVALPLLAEFFSTHANQTTMQNFIARNGALFYGLPLPGDQPGAGTVELTEQPWTVPAQYHGVVPLAAGSTLGWSVRPITKGKS